MDVRNVCLVHLHSTEPFHEGEVILQFKLSRSPEGCLGFFPHSRLERRLHIYIQNPLMDLRMGILISLLVFAEFLPGDVSRLRDKEIKISEAKLTKSIAVTNLQSVIETKSMKT